MPKSRVAIISIGVLLVICLVSLAFPTINMIKSISSKIESSDEVQSELTAEEKKVEDQALEAISKTSEILGQKIVSITQDIASKNTIYTFENGQKFELPSNAENNCLVGDKITSFEESANLLKCTDSANSSMTSNRGIYVPSSWLSGIVGGTVGAVASSVIFGRFFSGNTYLRNNGYTPSYTNGQNSFTNTRGDQYDFGNATNATNSANSSSVSNGNNNGGRRGTSNFGRTTVTKKPKTISGGKSGKSGSGKTTGGGTTGGFGSGGTTGTS